MFLAIKKIKLLAFQSFFQASQIQFVSHTESKHFFLVLRMGRLELAQQAGKFMHKFYVRDS